MHENLISLRFVLLLLLAMIFIPSSSYANYRAYVTRLADQQQIEQRNQDYLRKLWVAQIFTNPNFNLDIYWPPSPTSVFASGFEEVHPRHLAVGKHSVEFGLPLDVQLSLGLFGSIDYLFVVQFIFSLFAVLLSFDAITREKEKGTLRTILSNPLGRTVLATGKLLGGYVTLAMPLLVAFLTGLIALAASGLNVFSGDFPARTGWVLLSSLLYIAVFFLLGLLVSSLMSSTYAALVVSLALWLMTVLVMPRAGSLVSQLWKPVQSRQTTWLQKLAAESSLEQEKGRALQELVERVGVVDEDGRRVPGDDWQKHCASVASVYEERAAQAVRQIEDDYRRRKAEQRRLGLYLARLSPTGSLVNFVTEMSDTGISAEDRFMSELVVILMAASGFLFHAEYERQLADYDREVSRNLAELAERASALQPLFQAFSWNNQFIYRRPNPLGFIAEGHEKGLPNAFQVDAFRLEGLEYTLRGNPMLWRFESLDWAFIVSVILSFAAIVLVYDSISGEKERGTLRIVMSNSLSREKILLAKYLSAIITLLIPLTVGVLINLLIMTLQGTVTLDRDSWLRIGLVFVLCLVYISAFIMLGLFISARTKESVISLVISLLVWVLFVVVIPASGSLIAKGLVKLPMSERVMEEAERTAEEAFQNYNQRHPHPDNWIMSGNWSPGEPLLRAFEVDEAGGRVIEDYRNQMIAQVRRGQKIARLSPTALFTQATESVVESGLLHYEHFLQQARRYREALKMFLDHTYPLDKVYPLDREATDPVAQNMKLDFDSIPKFEDRLISSQEAVSQALWDVGGLVLLNLVLFGAAYASFLRYDVR